MFRQSQIKILQFVIIFQSCISDDIYNAVSQPAFQFKWATLLSGPTNEDEIDAVASDSKGNVYLSGKFETELSIEGDSQTISSMEWLILWL